MSLTLTEKRLDEKRRITIPSKVRNLKGGEKVVLVSVDDNAVVIARNADLAKQLWSLFRAAETKNKLQVLAEWDELIEKAGLSNITTRQIDQAVEEYPKKPKISRNVK